MLNDFATRSAIHRDTLGVVCGDIGVLSIFVIEGCGVANSCQLDFPTGTSWQTSLDLVCLTVTMEAKWIFPKTRRDNLFIICKAKKESTGKENENSGEIHHVVRPSCNTPLAMIKKLCLVCRQLRNLYNSAKQIILLVDKDILLGSTFLKRLSHYITLTCKRTRCMCFVNSHFLGRNYEERLAMRIRRMGMKPPLQFGCLIHLSGTMKENNVTRF